MKQLSLILCLILCGSAKAQESTCKAELQAILEGYTELGEPKNGKEHYMEYSVKATTWDENVRPSEDRMTIIYSNNFQVFKSAMVQLYQDLKSAYLVVPYKQKIYKSTSAAGVKNEGLAESIRKQKELLKYATITDCKDINGVSYNRVITLQVPEKYYPLLHVSELKYYVNTKASSVYKTELTGTKDNEVKTVTTTIHQFIKNRNVTVGAYKDFSSLFFTSKGELKKEFQNYELVVAE